MRRIRQGESEVIVAESGMKSVIEESAVAQSPNALFSSSFVSLTVSASLSGQPLQRVEQFAKPADSPESR